MAFTTIGTYLGIKETGTIDEDVIKANALSTSDEFVVHFPIVEYNNIGGEPEKVSSTTLSDSQETSENGVQQQENNTFTLQYDPEVYYKLKQMQDSHNKYQVGLLFSQSGSLFYWYGTISIQVSGGGVNEIAQMTLTVSYSCAAEIATTGGAVDKKWKITESGGTKKITHGN